MQAGSADACNEVLAAAARLGVTAETAVWLGPKPDTGIQAAARRARYHLLAEVANRQRLEVVATAHTEDDQAETLLMRLARGSGVDGLSGIAERIELAGVTFVRPLLGVTHGQLVATLVARGIGWRSDPANAEPRFERVRMREALTGGLADAAGLASRPLATSARRLARARRALGPGRYCRLC